MQSVPGPKPLPLIGTAYSVNPKNLVETATKLSKKYGELYVQQIPGRQPLYIVGSYRFLDELSDESRFKKVVHPAISAVRGFAGNGLFTAEQEDPEWEKAHRILMPAFNPVALKSMYDGMADIADQLMLKWSRLRADVDVDVTSEFTRLTLDTIALCSFSFRFNSFYSEDLHPFVDAMVDGLAESGKRAHALEVQKKINVRAESRFKKNISTMEETVDFLIAERRANPSPEGEEDILDVMLSAKDGITGESLDDENLRFQLVTFLIAGHETTSGMLSFALYELLKNPSVLQKARDITDTVLNGRFPEFSDLKSLGYLDQILRESLRKYPTVPGYAVTPYETTTIGKGWYGDNGEGLEINPGDTMFVLLGQVHRDPLVWKNPEKFDPERFSFENAKHIPHNAWKPFGNGQRSCIGRAFAIQEATLVLALLVQHFDFSLSDPSYELRMVDGLTSKPEDFYVHVSPRATKKYRGISGTTTSLTGGSASGEDGTETDISVAHVVPNGQKLQVLVGSNAGTSKNFARRLARYGEAQGFEVIFSDLDDAVSNIDRDVPVLICTSSYEGLPTDNARKFVEWLSSDSNIDLRGVNYAVFGSGNSEWASTYQRVPTFIDEQMAHLGANRIVDRGEADVRDDYVGSFEEWAQVLWSTLGSQLGITLEESVIEPSISVQMADGGRSDRLRSASDDSYVPGRVLANTKLSTDADGPINHKYRMDIQLPDGSSYSTGDYLDVLPYNPSSLVDRVLSRFGMTSEQRINIDGESTFLPTEGPVAVGDVLRSQVELTTPASHRAIQSLIDSCPCPPEQAALKLLLEKDTYRTTVQNQRRSIIDLLDEYPSVQMTFGEYLGLLQPLSPRRYSISSSSARDSSVASITYSHLVQPARSGRGMHEGVATSWLASAASGAVLTVAVVPGNDHFKAPENVEESMILIGAGTGIAPLRAFLEDVKIRSEAEGVPLGRSLLFYGCHGPSSDFLYKEEISDWCLDGNLDVRPAFSRHASEISEPVGGLIGSGTSGHVQDRLWNDRHDVLRMINSGSKVYVCGDAEYLAPAVRKTFIRILEEGNGFSTAEAANAVEKMERETFTYVTDAFS